MFSHQLPRSLCVGEESVRRVFFSRDLRVRELLSSALYMGAASAPCSALCLWHHESIHDRPRDSARVGHETGQDRRAHGTDGRLSNYEISNKNKRIVPYTCPYTFDLAWLLITISLGGAGGLSSLRV
jgi:hypothetical protein